jgi:[pyruvate, water dikinase]-phosphate phosphotransferase / [pyruvate, water dikinase] kinase
MYLALQHGIPAANFPLVEEDFASLSLPKPLLPSVRKCFGLTSQPVRLSQIRRERRPGSTYALLSQCAYELRNAGNMYRANHVPYVNSASMSLRKYRLLSFSECSCIIDEPAIRPPGRQLRRGTIGAF